MTAYFATQIQPAADALDELLAAYGYEPIQVEAPALPTELAGIINRESVMEF